MKFLDPDIEEMSQLNFIREACSARPPEDPIYIMSSTLTLEDRDGEADYDFSQDPVPDSETRLLEYLWEPVLDDRHVEMACWYEPAHEDD